MRILHFYQQFFFSVLKFTLNQVVASTVSPRYVYGVIRITFGKSMLSLRVSSEPRAFAWHSVGHHESSVSDVILLFLRLQA